MKKWTHGFLNVAAKFADWTSIFVLAFITVQLLVVVILRYVFFTNIRWLEQSSIILFVYLVFIPAGLLSRSGQHLNVEVLQEYLTRLETGDLKKPVALPAASKGDCCAAEARGAATGVSCTITGRTPEK